MPKKFQFTFTCDVTLDRTHLWPDEDGPEEPTLEDVVQLVRDHGDIRHVLGDWDLDEDLVLIVSDLQEGRGQRVE